MNQSEFWKNFRLGEELSVSGAFIYNGMRRFHEMRKLDYEDELFEFLYNLSVGFERLLKIAVVLHEHNESSDQDQLEKSLITHNHLDLVARLKKHTTLNLGIQHNELLHLLAKFYKSFRYDRFTIASTYNVKREREELCLWLAKHLNISIEVNATFLGTPNEDTYKKFVGRIIIKMARDLYEIISTQARQLNLFTYELRHGSKAESVFLRNIEIASEDVLWKELLVFLMNSKESSGYLDFIRSIEPLQFDPELLAEYLDCFKADASKSHAMDELEQLYQDFEGDVAQRLEEMSIIGAPNVYFPSENEEEVDVDFDQQEES